MKVLVTVIALSLAMVSLADCQYLDRGARLDLQFSPRLEDPNNFVRIQRSSGSKEMDSDPYSFIRILGKREGWGGFAGRIRLLKVDDSGKSLA